MKVSTISGGNSVLYAAYGSNLHPLRLRQRTPSARLLGWACVAGWSLEFHKRSVDESAKCNIVARGHGTFVAVYELSGHDKEILDGIKGIGRGYDLSYIDVPGFWAVLNLCRIRNAHRQQPAALPMVHRHGAPGRSGSKSPSCICRRDRPGGNNRRP